MHVMDHVQCTYIEVSQPVHHYIIFFHYFIIIKILGCDWCIFRSYLIVSFLIHTTVDCVKQAFCKVCTGTEELDFFSCLCGRYTAADGVIIAPYRTHYIVVLILDGTCLNRNMSCIFLEVLR